MNTHQRNLRLDRETKLAIAQSVDNIMRLWPVFDADAIETISAIEEWTGITPARFVQTMKNAAAHADKNGHDLRWVRQAILYECIPYDESVPDDELLPFE